MPSIYPGTQQHFLHKLSIQCLYATDFSRQPREVSALMYFYKKQLTLYKKMHFTMQLILTFKFCHRNFRRVILTYNTFLHSHCLFGMDGTGTFLCFSNTNTSTFSSVAQNSPAWAQNHFLDYKCFTSSDIVHCSTTHFLHHGRTVGFLRTINCHQFSCFK